jgi:ATP sulfurylase
MEWKADDDTGEWFLVAEAVQRGGTCPSNEQQEPEAKPGEEMTQTIRISQRALNDLALLTTGAFEPVRRFMTFDEARSVVEDLELPTGEAWPIPILLQSDDAQKLVTAISQRIAIEPIAFDEVFYCFRCAVVASGKTCGHGSSDRLSLSGTEVRRRLREGQSLPMEFTRPEVAAVLAEALRGEVLLA